MTESTDPLWALTTASDQSFSVCLPGVTYERLDPQCCTIESWHIPGNVRYLAGWRRFPNDFSEVDMRKAIYTHLAGPGHWQEQMSLETVSWFGLSGQFCTWSLEHNEIAAYLTVHQERVFFAASFGPDSPSRRTHDEVFFADFLPNRTSGPRWLHRSQHARVGRPVPLTD